MCALYDSLHLCTPLHSHAYAALPDTPGCHFLHPQIDLDVHSYTFLARKAINSFHSRLSEVVWENAFVVQGNSNDELPEQLLACARIYRADFEHVSQMSVADLAACTCPVGTMMQA